eukprot:gb/GEZJ01007128.1/.p1 GENE.gb/GEZJ01007128.1/~~gb/GEZJ01007128.1/.p1  ORF type:complete len:111 (-),score=19.17 gb/GEZJ01007128.1/:332-664(-)
MPLSMRRQTAKLKADQNRREDLEKRGEKVADLIKAHNTVAGTAAATSVSMKTIYRIKTAIQKHHNESLNNFLHPTKHHPGRTPILSQTEENMTGERAVFSSDERFTMEDY